MFCLKIIRPNDIIKRALLFNRRRKHLMKKVLSVIGGFFVSIWRWIKETAWVQPLLIVGIIFGVIFSIPSVVDGIRAIDEKRNSAETYYKKYKVSLTGAENSQADKLLKEIKDNEDGNSTTLAGKKFFLVFVSSTCSACESAREGFEYLTDDGKSLIKDGKNVTIKTIFTDEEFKKKDKEDWKGDKTDSIDNFAETAFEAFLLRNFAYFETYAGAIHETDYYVNGKITDTEVEEIESADVTKFKVPTVIQVDFTGEARKDGVTNVFIYNESNVLGSTKRAKGEYLAAAWNYDGMFGPNYNG